MMKPLHYLVLVIVITFSVTAGNLISNQVTAMIAANALQKASNEHAANRQRALEKALREKEIRAENMERARRASPAAKKLLRQCNDWKKQNGQRDTDISRTEMEKSCQAYTRYIQTGRI